MRKILLIMAASLALFGLAGCKKESAGTETPDTAASEEVLTGTADGYGGQVIVTLTRKDGKIVDVQIVGDKETEGVGTLAIQELPAKIKEANSSEVDVVASATITSNAIIYAVNNALDPAAYPYPIVKEETAPEAETVSASGVYQGFGIDNSGRIGPGKDEEEVSVYGINQILANVLFDEQGKIITLYIDQMEVVTPNSSGESGVHFSGFPGQGGYNTDNDHDEKLDGKTDDTEENFLAEIATWNTKRDRGENYKMVSGSWASQMDAYQKFFVGMTVAEIQEWFDKYCSDINGRPLKADSAEDQDKTKYDALSDDEKTMLADVITGATMSLNDSHGNIVGAIMNAYENRVPVELTSAGGIGIGYNNSGRTGFREDDQGVPMYSVNQVFANTVFDKDNRIAAIYIDQVEYTTPNYSGDGTPHFSGFPGQKPYNNDEDHDGKVDGTLTPTEDTFSADIKGWVTKRARGDNYKMNSGSWASEMDAYQKLFIGKTVEEVEEWFNKYCSDVNGRPLKADSEDEKDIEKYGTLSDEDKTMLADVVTGATMSLNDDHGNVIAAIKMSLEKKADIDLTVQ